MSTWQKQANYTMTVKLDQISKLIL